MLTSTFTVLHWALGTAQSGLEVPGSSSAGHFHDNRTKSMKLLRMIQRHGCIPPFPIWEFLKIRWCLFGDPYNKDFRIIVQEGLLRVTPMLGNYYKQPVECCSFCRHVTRCYTADCSRAALIKFECTSHLCLADM